MDGTGILLFALVLVCLLVVGPLLYEVGKGKMRSGGVGSWKRGMTRTKDKMKAEKNLAYMLCWCPLTFLQDFFSVDSAFSMLIAANVSSLSLSLSRHT